MFYCSVGTEVFFFVSSWTAGSRKPFKVKCEPSAQCRLEICINCFEVMAMLNHRKAYTVALLNARAPKQDWDTVNLLATDFFFFKF